MGDIGTIHTKSGKMLTVRPLGAEDVDECMRYINTLIAEDTFILMSGNPVTRDEEMKWVEGALKDVEHKQAVTLLIFDGKNLIANSSIKKRPRRVSHIGDFGITVVKEYRGQGVGKQLMNLVLEEAKKIGIQIAVLEAFGNNEIACSMYQKLGFETFGTLPKSAAFRGELIDLISMYKRLI